MLERIIDAQGVKVIARRGAVEQVEKYVSHVGGPRDLVGCTVGSVYSDYCEFCVKKGLGPCISKNMFGRVLNRLYGVKSNAVYAKGRTVRAYTSCECDIARS